MTNSEHENILTQKPAAGPAERYLSLAAGGVLSEEELRQAERSAIARGIEIETVLLRDYNVPRRALLQALSSHYNLPFVEYDERMPVPSDLLSGLDGERLSLSQWFPLVRNNDTIIIAANDPDDPEVIKEVRNCIKAENYEFRVSLGEDIQWFIQDFLHARPGSLIGTERTNLAFWRNTMAQWRTRLACYRNDLARGRTGLALQRWGLGLIALADALMRTPKLSQGLLVNGLIMASGFGLALSGLVVYMRIRRSRMKPPGHHTLVEVTAATLQFLENYHFIEGTGVSRETRKTMLGRLGDLLSNHSTILTPTPASRERTQLARERNVLAAQRTLAACYRTIYSRARTGLAFIRSGVSFLVLGLGLTYYFGISLQTMFDALLVLAGGFMIVDGVLWYMPVRREQAEIPRCSSPL